MAKAVVTIVVLPSELDRAEEVEVKVERDTLLHAADPETFIADAAKAAVGQAEAAVHAARIQREAEKVAKRALAGCGTAHHDGLKP